ncbi:unnamed protein product [Schistosoma intercalatum]|nr:unnamed protein product [Schistosoma intercalatum]CAH8565949.1 unnamed protein product [Schistosoma intercalatum]
MKLLNLMCIVILCRTISFSLKSTNEAEDYFYFNILYDIPIQYQYIMRAGYSPGQFGTEQNTIIIPPESHGKSKLIELYTNINEYEKFINSNHMRTNNFHYKFYQTLIKLHKLKLQTHEINKHFYEYLIPNRSNTRIQFIMYYCTALLDFNEHSNGDYANSTTTISAKRFRLIVRQDIHQFCPKACAYRGGPGFNIKHKTELNRYTSLCNFPKHFMTVSSQRCIEQNNVGLVNLQSFKCDCSNGFIWKEQVKACYLPYGWRQKAERLKWIVNTKRSDQFIYYAQNNCSRIGTKFIQPIEIHTKNSNKPNYDKLHHTERCICKDEFYGTNCDQKKDPCKMRIGDVLMGDIACRTIDGNKCIPHEEFGTYTCQCITGFRKLTNSSLLPRKRVSDNCLVLVDPCIVKPCKHGICVISEYDSANEAKPRFKDTSFSWFENEPHLISRCICNNGWKGERCDSPISINVWSPWSQWSFGAPSYHSSFKQILTNNFSENKGYSMILNKGEIRQRSRYREFLSKASDCEQEEIIIAGYRWLLTKNEEMWQHYENQASRTQPYNQHLCLTSGISETQLSHLLRQLIRGEFHWFAYYESFFLYILG